jgi:hypothetical protein
MVLELTPGKARFGLAWPRGHRRAVRQALPRRAVVTIKLERRYYISSRKFSATELAQAVRGHWVLGVTPTPTPKKACEYGAKTQPGMTNS